MSLTNNFSFCCYDAFEIGSFVSMYTKNSRKGKNMNEKGEVKGCVWLQKKKLDNRTKKMRILFSNATMCVLGRASLRELRAAGEKSRFTTFLFP